MRYSSPQMVLFDAPSLRRMAAAAAMLFIAAPAMAQYLWIDEKGVKQFSDRPPPPTVPYNRILKAPGKEKLDLNPATTTEGEGDVDAEGSKPEPKIKAPPTLAERNADFNKRKAEAAEAAKKSGEESARKADIAANCEAARNNQRALDQGMRMSNYDKNGERGIMGDAERAEASKKNKAVLANCR